MLFLCPTPTGGKTLAILVQDLMKCLQARRGHIIIIIINIVLYVLISFAFPPPFDG